MKAIVVTGSRHWKPTKSNLIYDTLDDHAPDVLIHGAAPGADTEAEHWALTSLLVQVIPCPADWDGEGKAAGPKRNGRMLRLLLALRECRYEIAVVAYPLPGSRGTWDLVNRAKRAGVTVHVHEE